jgi:hypothetical protein
MLFGHINRKYVLLKEESLILIESPCKISLPAMHGLHFLLQTSPPSQSFLRQSNDTRMHK